MSRRRQERVNVSWDGHVYDPDDPNDTPFHRHRNKQIVDTIDEFDESCDTPVNITRSGVTPDPSLGPALPWWPDDRLAAPSALLRGALFSAARHGHDRSTTKRGIAAGGGVSISITGPALDQTDLDVFLAVTAASTADDGLRVTTTARGLLKRMGRTGGGSMHARIWDSLRRLSETIVQMSGPRGQRYSGALLAGVARDGDAIVIDLPPALSGLYHRGYTQIDRSHRAALPGGLARWLHAYLSALPDPIHPHRIDTIRQMAGSGRTGRHWREDLRAACGRVSAVTGWTLAIDADDRLVVTR